MRTKLFPRDAPICHLTSPAGDRPVRGMSARPAPAYSRLLLAALLVPALIATGLAQVVPDNVVQTPEVIVNATPLSSDSAGVTTLDLQPETGPAAGSWDVLSRSVANLHIADSGAGGYGSLFSLRGLANTPYFSEPSVTVYLADIPLPSSFTYPMGLFGFNSVSVYRGPEGTEFGRATDGGVILFSPDTSARAEGGELFAGFGSYDARQAATSVHSAQSGMADAEVDADFSARNGYITNQELGIRVDDQENEDLFARLRLRPAKGAELTLEILRTRARDGAQPLVPLGGPLFEVNRAQEGVTDLDSVGAALKGSFSLPDSATLTAVTSYTAWQMNPYQSFLVLPPPLENRILQDQKRWNEEIHLQSDPHSKLRGAMGVWLSKGTTDNGVDRAIPDLFPIEVSGFEERDQTAALFGSATYTLNQSWQIVAGLRAETTYKDFMRTEEVPTPGLVYIGDGRYDGILPKVALDWTINPTSHVEASVADGLRAGGFASYTDKPALIPFSSEHSTAFSVGWDTSFAQNSADVAIRAFYDQITNLQIERSFSQTDYLVATAPRAHSTGAEIEGRWHPSPQWTIGTSAGWTYVRLDQFFAPLTGQNESGMTAPNAPQFNADLEATFRPGGGWFAAGQLSAVGRTYFDELETAKYTQDAYALVGLRAGYEAARWSFTVYGENLADKGYYSLIIPGVNSGDPGSPRTFGVKLALRF
jgi:iron complex outermembrane receptor protein